jgi:hypothetical protein
VEGLEALIYESIWSQWSALIREQIVEECTLCMECLCVLGNCSRCGVVYVQGTCTRQCGMREETVSISVERERSVRRKMWMGLNYDEIKIWM